MLRKKSFLLVLMTVLLIPVLLSGCLVTDFGKSDWTATGGDPAFSAQERVPNDQLVSFGTYPQSLADSAVSSIIGSKVVIDEVTGLWTVYNISVSVDMNGKKRTDADADKSCWDVRYVRSSEIDNEDEYTYNKSFDGTKKILTKEEYDALDKDMKSNYVEDKNYYLGWTSEDGLVNKKYTGVYSSYDVKTGYYDYYTYEIESLHANDDAAIEGKEVMKKTDGAVSYYAQANGSYYLVEPIKWIVLEDTGSEYVLIASDILDSGRPFNDVFTNVDWDKSSMRDWLNGTDDYDDETGSKYSGTWNFYDKAFSESDRSFIVTTTNKTAKNEQFGSAGCPDTEDKVYLLSVEELNKYFITVADGKNTTKTLYPMGFASAYAIKRGATAGKHDEVSWWLRTTGASAHMLSVNRSASVSEGGFAVNDKDIGIRPVIRVSKDAISK